MKTYVLPNLIFFALVVIAWVNIDLARNAFQFESPVERREYPLVVMRDGEQKYTEDNTHTYTLKYSAVEIYPDNRLKAKEPDLFGTWTQAGLPTKYRLRGSQLNRDREGAFLLRGTPAQFTLDKEETKVTAKGRSIRIDTKEQLADIYGEEELVELEYTVYNKIHLQGLSENLILSHQEERVELNGKAQLDYTLQNKFHIQGLADNAVIFPQEERVELNGKAQLDYKEEEGNRLKLSANKMRIAQETMEIIGEAKIEHKSNTGDDDKLVRAEAESAFYRPDGKLIMRGTAKIWDETSELNAETISYDTLTGLWRAAGEDINRDEDAKVRIIIDK